MCNRAARAAAVGALLALRAAVARVAWSASPPWRAPAREARGRGALADPAGGLTPVAPVLRRTVGPQTMPGAPSIGRSAALLPTSGYLTPKHPSPRRSVVGSMTQELRREVGGTTVVTLVSLATEG